MLFIAFLSVFCLALAICFGISFLDFLRLLIYKMLFEFLLISITITTFLWFLTNKYLKNPGNANQDVEWLYAFDIHCNASFPFFMATDILKFIMFPFLLSSFSYMSLLLSNGLYLAAFAYYCFVTSRGYAEMKFLKDLEYFLYPIAVGIVLFLVGFIFQINIALLILQYQLHSF